MPSPFSVLTLGSSGSEIYQGEPLYSDCSSVFSLLAPIVIFLRRAAGERYSLHIFGPASRHFSVVMV